jgi:hypothetical protein
MNGAPDSRYERFRFVPQPGDVIVIEKLSVVHSVVGCVLAEFATVSTDMVDRLHDQNEGRPIPLEFTRAFFESRIRSLAWPETSRRVAFESSSWSRAEIASRPVAGGRQTVLGNDPRFSASLFRIDAGGHGDTSTVPDRATCLHVAAGSGQLLLGSADELRRSSPPSLAATAGDLFLIAPGAHYAIVNDTSQPLAVARHEISPDVAFV